MFQFYLETKYHQLGTAANQLTVSRQIISIEMQYVDWHTTLHSRCMSKIDDKHTACWSTCMHWFIWIGVQYVYQHIWLYVDRLLLPNRSQTGIEAWTRQFFTDRLNKTESADLRLWMPHFKWIPFQIIWKIQSIINNMLLKLCYYSFQSLYLFTWQNVL